MGDVRTQYRPQSTRKPCFSIEEKWEILVMSVRAIEQRIEHLDPNTQRKYWAYVRKFGITDKTTWRDVRASVEKIPNQNTRRGIIIGLRTILGSKGAPRIPKAVAKVYELPDREDIFALQGTPYFAYIVLMAFAGLRAGEVCCIKAHDIKRVGDRCFIDVGQSKQYSGRIKEAKTTGRVFIPLWVYDLLIDADYPDILPNSLYKWMKRRGLAPHQLRHFYATTLVRATNNPELVRRQLRHSNLETTLSVYAQVETEDESALLEAL
jgi:integrase